ncbi:50S ribosome-binding GTPase [Helicobacter pylori]|nr:50S ribosome-binding GTPase [Helicobacter pylori]
MKNETLEQFKRNQKRNQEILKKLLDFVHTGEEYGIKVEDFLKDKIRNAMENVAGQKLKVALVGGFSEGKTSIAAAWIDRLDKESMKIDHQESSDEVKIYDIDNEIELVDTPGLFGFEKKEHDSGKIERYKDITKKYVSEAHLILYALNPSNPIKESHKDDLNWLFRTLNLLSRTIFVISRFDEEADIEDEEDYNKRFKIKKENIQNRLNDLISLSEEEKESLETFNDFVIREIGDKGINIETKVQNEFERQTQGIVNEIVKIGTSFNADVSSFEKYATTLGRSGINFLKQSGFINATNIKLARDALVATGKFVGIDLALKFKPWGAVNLAGNINKGLPLIGLAFEVWDSWKESQKIEKLEKAKEEMKSNFDNQKKEILDLINDETRFKQTCFPSVLELEKSFQEIEEKIKKTQECDQEFEKWIQTGEDFIEVEPKRGMN